MGPKFMTWGPYRRIVSGDTSYTSKKLLWQPRFQAGHHCGCRELPHWITLGWNGAVDDIWSYGDYGDGIFFLQIHNLGRFPRFPKTLTWLQGLVSLSHDLGILDITKNSSHYRPYTQWLGDVQWWHSMTHVYLHCPSPVPRPVRGSSVFTLATLVTLVALGEAVTEKCIARGEVFSTPALAKRNRPKRGTPSDVWHLSGLVKG